MNLLEIRKEFRNVSGRYDLVPEDDSDNGANFLINEGSKWLDRTTTVNNASASSLQIVAADTLYAQFPNCRAVKEVWLVTADGRWQLEKKNLQDLIAGYLEDLPAVRTSGTPLYYAPTLTRYIPEDMSAIDIATYMTYLEVIQSTGYNYNSVLFNIPLELQALVDVRGLFYSIEMSADTDSNFWSTVHPMLLIQAATRQSHVITGNGPALKTITEELRAELTKLEFDMVEEDIAEADQMEKDALY